MVPDAVRRERNARVHGDRDLEAHARAAALADLLRRDPSLIRRTLAALERRRASAPDRLKSTLDEWRRLLITQPPARLAKLLVEPDARMTRLRQTLPFTDVLSPDEGERFDTSVAHYLGMTIPSQGTSEGA